ncbi:MAG: radical SAM protein [Deltaproteobacteria bacterium]|nr:radical SAM protein [Deltaproteobacteria bacterium]
MKPFSLRLVAWEMTRRCNLKCIHCRAGACDGIDPNELTYQEGIRLIDGIREQGAPILIMTGGEPLLRKDFFELADYAIRSGLRAVLATNGSLVTLELAREIAAVGIPRASVSLDGPTAQYHDLFRGVPGAFKSSLHGIKMLRAAGVGVQINTTLTRRNRHQLPEMIKLAEKLDAAAFHVFLLVPTGRARDMSGEEMGPEEYEQTLLEFYQIGRKTKLETKATCAPQYYRILRQQLAREGIEVTESAFGLNAHTRGCLGGLSFVFVSHTGDVQPCGYFDDKAGSIRENSFSHIWLESELFQELRNFKRLEGKCGKCDYIRFCGGCRARAYELTGRRMAEEPYCAYQPPAFTKTGSGSC